MVGSDRPSYLSARVLPPPPARVLPFFSFFFLSPPPPPPPTFPESGGEWERAAGGLFKVTLIFKGREGEMVHGGVGVGGGGVASAFEGLVQGSGGEARCLVMMII